VTTPSVFMMINLTLSPTLIFILVPYHQMLNLLRATPVGELTAV
jgi:hypothetical protein